MANTAAAKKAYKQALERTARNLQIKKKVELLRRKIALCLKNKKIEEVEKLYHDLQKLVDKAAKNNIFHPNKSSRIKARIVKALHQIKKK
jgi:ribosomal protein S20